MKLVRASTQILTKVDGIEILKTLESVARTCYKSEDKITQDGESAKNLVKTLLGRNHEAMLEFADITVKFICDRGVSHEIVRHRIASFAQESTRFVNYSPEGKTGQCTFIIPCFSDIQESEWTHLQAISSTNLNGVPADLYWLQQMAWSETTYNRLIKEGWKPEEARSVLPNSTKTEINVKMNLREWRHFFKLRTAKAAHPQMRELTTPLLAEFKSLIPLLFDDITV